MLNISIASVIEFDDGTAPGTAYIENVPGNHYAMKVRIVLDDTGDVVYESGGLKPAPTSKPSRSLRIWSSAPIPPPLRSRRTTWIRSKKWARLEQISTSKYWG